MATIEAEGVTVSFGSRRALDDVWLSLPAGSSTAVMGANGSGKTTLLDCLAGLRRPDRGRILGIDPNRVGYVVQHAPTRWMPITVREVVAMGRFRARGLVGRTRTEDRDAVSRAVDRLAVGDLLGSQFGTLSGGQQQRVRVAQVLAAEPALLLLDEPVTGLDPPSQERILEVVRDETSAGHHVVVTTHHLDEARHCDAVALLAHRVVALGPPDEVLTPDRLRDTFGTRVLGDHDGHDHDHSLLMLDDHGHGHEH